MTVELLMVGLSVPAGLLGWGLGVLLRRHREVGAHECGESVAELTERLSGDVQSCPPPARAVH